MYIYLFVLYITASYHNVTIIQTYIYAREQLGEVPGVEGPVQEISREEVKKAIHIM